MDASRRRALQVIGTGLTVALSGCSTDLRSDGQAVESTLTAERIDSTPVEYAHYEPPDDDLFGAPARAALDAILPEGRHTTRGYEPLSDGQYVDHEGEYYRIAQFVTGRTTLTRPHVRVDAVDSSSVPDDAVALDSLDRPSARALKILYTAAATDGEGGGSDLLREDAYVLVRPAERESRLATGDLDGRVVTVDDDGDRGYRVEISSERVTLAEHTATAIRVATSREAFREVVFASRIDAELAPADLGADQRECLAAATRDRYREQGERSAAFGRLLDALGFVPEQSGRRLVWYDGALYRVNYYVDGAV